MRSLHEAERLDVLVPQVVVVVARLFHGLYAIQLQVLREGKNGSSG